MVVQCYGTQQMLKSGLNRPVEIVDEIDEREERMSDLLFDSVTDEKETNSPIKVKHQESNDDSGYNLPEPDRERCDRRW